MIKVKLVLADNTVVVGTIVRETPDHVLLSDTNIHNDWVWIETYNIKEREALEQ